MTEQLKAFKENNIPYVITDDGRIIISNFKINDILNCLEHLHDIVINGLLYLNDLTSVDKDFLSNTTICGSLILDGLKKVHKYFLSNTTINGYLYLNGLTSVDKDFLLNTTVNGSLSLNGLTSVHKDFLAITTIGGYLSLKGLKSVHKDFLKNITIDGYLSLSGLTSVHKDFLANTTINGSLYLNGLTSVDKDFLANTTINGYLVLDGLPSSNKRNLKCYVTSRFYMGIGFVLKEGYHVDLGVCYFDGILDKVLSVKVIDDFTVYNCLNGVVISKDNINSHGKDFKDARRDYIFKTTKHVTNQFKNLNLDESREIDDLYMMYRVITGSCRYGTNNFINRYQEKVDKVKSINDVIALTTETKAYRNEVFKQFFSK